MTDARVDERRREHAAHGWYDAPREGQVPVRSPEGTAGAATGAAAAAPDTTRAALARWKRRALRVLRDAVIGAALIGMVPVGLVTLTRRQLPYGWYQTGAVNTLARQREAEQARRLASPRDPSVGPQRAGVALAELIASPSARLSPTLQPRDATARPAWPWRSASMPAELFGGQSGPWWNGPSPIGLMPRVARGVSPAELAYLRMIATAPVWPAFDLVTSAPAVDVIAGRYQLPFSRDARIQNLPMWSFAAAKELAYANVSRAAYFLAIGKPAEADAILRRTIGFGFVFIDNASSGIDALIGRVIVGIGRGALHDLYAVTNDARLADVVAAEREVKAIGGGGRALLGNDEARQVHLGGANNVALPRAVRLEHLAMLAQSVCTNPRELVLGPGRDVRDAFARAQGTLARFPSERALLDLMLQSPSLPVKPVMNVGGPVRLVVGASTIASLIFDNPRLTYCTRVITSSLP